jgi:HK97 family phage major capsid protein
MDFDITDIAPEHKSGGAVRGGYDDFRVTFEEFKATNDERLARLEQKRGDVLLEEKVDRINAALDAQHRRMDELALKNARPALEGRTGILRDAGSREHKSAFEAYVRGGETGALRALETKAMSAGSNPDGGYLVPVELEHEIGERLAAISPIRALASVRTISGNVYKKPFMTAGPATGWVGETDSRTQTTSPTLDALSFPAMELYAMPAATATLLDDSAVNIDEWIAQEVELTFAVQEGAAFVNGDGTNQPKGFCNPIRLRTARGCGASWVTLPAARLARSPRAIRRMRWSI